MSAIIAALSKLAVLLYVLVLQSILGMVAIAAILVISIGVCHE